MNECTHSGRSDERGSHTTLAGTQSVSQPMPLTTAPRAIHSAVPIDPRSRLLHLASRAILFRSCFSLFFSFFLENSKEPEEVREEGLFLENNLFRFFDIILRGDDFFFSLRESFGQVFFEKENGIVTLFNVSFEHLRGKFEFRFFEFICIY